MKLKGVLMFVEILEVWQATHCLHHKATSFFRKGQTNLVEMSS